jgi:hypothetical protein
LSTFGNPVVVRRRRQAETAKCSADNFRNWTSAAINRWLRWVSLDELIHPAHGLSWITARHRRDVANYIRVKITGQSDRSDTRIDRQRRIIGLILFVVFIGLPAVLILLST